MFPKESIIPWILGMYFYNLSFIKEVEELLITDQYLSYGAFLTQNETMRAKYRWNYIGTFFWVNSKALRNYLISQKNSVPPLDNRYYAEEWLGNLYKSWPDKNAASHKLAYLKEAENYYKYTRHYINLLYADISDFKNFYKEITNEEY